MSTPTIPQLARGLRTTDFWLVALVVLGIDTDTAAALLGGVPDAEQIKAVVAMLHGEGWQTLLVKGALVAAYIWARDRNKQIGVSLEAEKLRLASARVSPAIVAVSAEDLRQVDPQRPYDADLTKDTRP